MEGTGPVPSNFVLQPNLWIWHRTGWAISSEPAAHHPDGLNQIRLLWRSFAVQPPSAHGLGFLGGKLSAIHVLYDVVFVCPLNVGHIISVIFQIGKAALFIAAYICICLSAKGGNRYSSCYRGIRAKAGCGSCTKEPTICIHAPSPPYCPS